jgi:peptide/nickel transport system ATP-binding protein
MTGAPALEVRDLHRRFRVQGGLLAPDREVVAVDGVSFSVPTGEVLGVVGESGCGKSTLARLILGLLPPTAGEVLVEGRRLAELDRRGRARLIQPVFQDPYSSLNPRRRVKDIVGLPLVAQGDMKRREIAARVEAMLERVGLSAGLGKSYPAELSGGQRQRVAIARALVLGPRIVVCDEPTSALDVSVQAHILNLLAELRRELGLTCLFISHNLAVVEHVATQVAVMYLGRIVEQAPAGELLAAPAHPYTQALLASVLTPEPGLGVPDVALGAALPDPTDIPAGCRFHPRCPSAFGRCPVEPPGTWPRAAGGFAECHLLDPAARGGGDAAPAQRQLAA